LPDYSTERNTLLFGLFFEVTGYRLGKNYGELSSLAGRVDGARTSH
jgi:hypothetical protein